MGTIVIIRLLCEKNVFMSVPFNIFNVLQKKEFIVELSAQFVNESLRRNNYN